MKKVIDAQNKTIGRVAQEAARLLMGKDEPTYTPNATPTVQVVIENAAQTSITDKKMEEKKYSSFSGYPGGLSFTPLNKVIEKKGFQEVYRKAVYGMLPKNKLRAEMLKNLTVTD